MSLLNEIIKNKIEILTHNTFMVMRFIIFGIIGWCMEILWTGFASLLKKDFRLVSNTSIWMFFIYGLAVFLEPVCDLVMDLPVVLRGGVYVLCIFAAEFAAGWIMTRYKLCPWDYTGAKFSIKGIIRLDYAPVWFAAGLIFEFVHRRYL